MLPKPLQLKVISRQHCFNVAVCVDDTEGRDVAPDVTAESVRCICCHSNDVVTVQV